jgi:hypothetical protein
MGEMITVKVDGINQAISMLSDLGRSQLPFATAKALTQLANESRAEIVKDLPSNFTLRNQWWRPGSQFGMNVKTAKKTDWPRPVAEVYTRAHWMIIQETGGVKRPVSGSNLAIPTRNVRRNKRDIITAANRPSGSAMAKAFKKTIGGDSYLVKPSKKSLLSMYLIKPSANVRKKFGFEITVREIVARRWSTVFSNAVADAIRTAR